MKNLQQFLRDFQGERVLMTIYPHPDDETMAAGGMLMEAKRQGYKTVVGCLTNGEAGQNHLGTGRESLAIIRKSEMLKALKILMVDKLELRDFGDGKLKGTERLWRKWVVDMIEKYNPGIVVTYDLSGSTGHPDHIALSVEVKNILKKYKKATLFWNTLSSDYAKLLPWTRNVRQFISPPTHKLSLLNLKCDFWIKAKAAATHASQKLGKDLPVPLWLVLALYHFEWYHQVDLEKEYPFKYVPFKI